MEEILFYGCIRTHNYILISKQFPFQLAMISNNYIFLFTIDSQKENIWHRLLNILGVRLRLRPWLRLQIILVVHRNTDYCPENSLNNESDATALAEHINIIINKYMIKAGSNYCILWHNIVN